MMRMPEKQAVDPVVSSPERRFSVNDRVLCLHKDGQYYAGTIVKKYHGPLPDEWHESPLVSGLQYCTTGVSYYKWCVQVSDGSKYRKKQSDHPAPAFYDVKWAQK